MIVVYFNVFSYHCSCNCTKKHVAIIKVKWSLVIGHNYMVILKYSTWLSCFNETKLRQMQNEYQTAHGIFDVGS